MLDPKWCTNGAQTVLCTSRSVHKESRIYFLCTDRLVHILCAPFRASVCVCVLVLACLSFLIVSDCRLRVSVCLSLAQGTVSDPLRAVGHAHGEGSMAPIGTTSGYSIRKTFPHIINALVAMLIGSVLFHGKDTRIMRVILVPGPC